MSLLRAIIALAAGSLITLSLAPFNIWPLAIIAAATLYILIARTNLKHTFWLCFLFSLALFLSGASWVYVSIHEFGHASLALSAFLSLLFCAGIALCNATILSAFFYLRNTAKNKLWINIFIFAAIGTASEFLRSYLLTGFPWLFIGYSQTESILAGWAPIFGIYGISFFLYASSALIGFVISQQIINRQALVLAACIVVIWALAPLLERINWSKKQTNPLTASLVQANISQHDKWKPENYNFTLNLYSQMSEPLWQHSNVVIWPEAAIPAYYSYAKPFIQQMAEQANAHKSALITGIPSRTFQQDDQLTQHHNSVIATGNAKGIYHKQHLVPFGEYIPFSHIVGKLMQFFELPLSSMQPGKKQQVPLRISHWKTQPLICYEIVYPALTAQAAQQSDVLVTVSNDSWFGASLGPKQHLQMAQMRAIENGRYVLRATANGISAIIDNKGKIVSQSRQFKREVLQGDFHLMQGSTPWTRYGYWLVHWLYATPLAIRAAMLLNRHFKRY